ncbi:DUF2484 family protein [Aliishimia ponticola]|uniref:DUF2484 family protein n=1 Tax=Aliishimia ponticola TaxID=2499833 RepID=A0A4S4NL92_9RHOB|nr:DUF2484 family protein [Aliishimia ponticola]THH39058.1 DUF2484 family protein [Aliishimia ponticola]
MTLLYTCIAWVLASSVVAMLPMRRQYVPGVMLLIAAPLLIIWIWLDIGWWAGMLAAAAFVSMFRNPLRYLWARLKGQTPKLPD